MKSVLMCSLAMLFVSPAIGQQQQTVIERLSINGEADEKGAGFVLRGDFRPPDTDKEDEKVFFTSESQNRISLNTDRIDQTIKVEVKVLQGKLKELVYELKGEGRITMVKGSQIRFWGIRRDPEGVRYLVLHPIESKDPVADLSFTATVSKAIDSLPVTVTPLLAVPVDSAMFRGILHLNPSDPLELKIRKIEAMTALSPTTVSTQNSSIVGTTKEPPRQFEYYSKNVRLTLDLNERDPSLRTPILQNFSLVGQVRPETVTFKLTGEIEVKHPEGGSLRILSGEAAITAFKNEAKMELRLEKGVYIVTFSEAGHFPLELSFHAGITEQNGWKQLDFQVAQSALRPVIIKGLSESTRLIIPGASNPVFDKGLNHAYLPPGGIFKPLWKESEPLTESKLFFSVEATSQITISPGLMNQANLMEYEILQGKLDELKFQLKGVGEITRVEGKHILTWSIDETEIEAEANRVLTVKLNQAQIKSYQIGIHSQKPLGAFPLTTEILRLLPQGPVRFGGHLRIVNQGAVRLDIQESPGLSQISPNQFPAGKGFQATNQVSATQTFAYRFSTSDFGITIQADNILPELTLSQILIHHLGETDRTIDAELELDIREAPLREFTLEVPADYNVSQLKSAFLSDYFTTLQPNGITSSLRILFSQPLIGRQVIQLRLEKNKNLDETEWTLPRVHSDEAKSIRGFLAVTADPGIRLTATNVEQLTEIAATYFPRKLDRVQAAYRLRNGNWNATLSVERMEQSIQVDALHLYTISQGIAYGSSVLNYLIAGAPVSTFLVEVPTDVENIEFTGNDIRNWEQVDNQYQVHLHSPISGLYTLLASYDRTFSEQEIELSFTGLTATEVQAEQGHVIVISGLEFQATPSQVSAGLIKLDSEEIPNEHRLLFDSPVLAAYQYTRRPFELSLNLSSMSQGDSLRQVIDYASLATHISDDGEILTQIRYLLKSRGRAHLRLALPPEIHLWSAMVDSQRVLPITDSDSLLIPLPTEKDAGKVLTLDLKIASKSDPTKTIRLEAPSPDAPALLTDWKVTPDEGSHLFYLGGIPTPKNQMKDDSGVRWLQGLVSGHYGARKMGLFWLALIFLITGNRLLNRGTEPSGDASTTVYGFRLTGGWILLAGAAATLLSFAVLAALSPIHPASGLQFSIPIQDSGSNIVLQLKNQIHPNVWTWFTALWPAVGGITCWILVIWKRPEAGSRLLIAFGWGLIAWSLLRIPNGAPLFFLLLLGFSTISILFPAAPKTLRFWKKQIQKKKTPPLAGTALILIACRLLFPVSTEAQTKGSPSAAANPQHSFISSMIQSGSVKDSTVTIKAHMVWNASAGESMVFLKSPAILTQLEISSLDIELSQMSTKEGDAYQLTTDTSGLHPIEFEYQIPVNSKNGMEGFNLPTHFGLINQLDLDFNRADLIVSSQGAVSIMDTSTAVENAGKDLKTSSVKMVLKPENSPRIQWRPRVRDTGLEAVVFYAEWAHLVIPNAGVIEAIHDVAIRPAQGELKELEFSIPAGQTISDVQTEALADWRFDPDTGLLRVGFQTPRAQPFKLRIRSQTATSPLPITHSVSFPTVKLATGQLGLIGLATNEEVQLDHIEPKSLTPINLEDFSRSLLQEALVQSKSLTLRRAFRYSDSSAQLKISATAVTPDVRVVSQSTISLGEDRTVLSAVLNVSITRSGLFKLSSPLPDGFEVESISGDALSHWTESTVNSQRIINLNLKGKTLGNHRFTINLAGGGISATPNWIAPRIVINEASKQSGQLIVAPEQGMRLQVQSRSGLTQSDPHSVGIRRKGVLLFRLLQKDWSLELDILKVDPWVEVDLLQKVAVKGGMIQVSVDLQYSVENAGIRNLRMVLPENAESIRFFGDYVGDSLRAEDANAESGEWEIRLNRRIFGPYRLQIVYRIPVAEQDQNGMRSIQGIRLNNINLQKGYLTLESEGRLEIRISTLPEALKPTEWQSIPTPLRQIAETRESSFTYRIAAADFTLPIEIVRHEAADILPAQITATSLTSVISEDGSMVTEVSLIIQPEEKRLLQVELPPHASFWFAFVNRKSVQPWTEGKRILIPLEKQAEDGKLGTVEFFYSSSTLTGSAKSSNPRLIGPQFDLPLSEITWNVFVPESWNITEGSGTLDLQEGSGVVQISPFNLESYLRGEVVRQNERSREAEKLLELGNSYLVGGRQKEARKAFQSAYSLSQDDQAFNEDARVQLQNLRKQQAVLGLNFRQQLVREEQQKSQQAPTGNSKNEFTQAEVDQILFQNSKEQNAVLEELAERLVKQQETVAPQPEIIRAILPQQGKQLVLTRSLQIETWSDLYAELKIDPTSTTHKTYWILLPVLLAFFFLVLKSGKSR
ncbi:MAG TPA: hypothetical protein EYQ50_27170 [Verrucomicrobiales bacterium]|nr:hypothetical protein [Verrucomicrobiales bacterium]